MMERMQPPLSPALIAGNANPALGQKIAAAYGEPLAAATVGRFSDGEVRVEIGQNLRQRDVFLLQPTCPPVNENIMELLILADACRRASARSITAIIPYFGYGRGERKSTSRRPIAAKLVMDMLTSAGVNRILSVDLHAAQIQGFTNVPVDNLFAAPLMAADIKEKYPKNNNFVVVSPDAGGVRRAKALAKVLECPIAIIDKRREAVNQSKVFHVIGEVRGKTCILFDDMVDTAGTICNAATALVSQGGAEAVVAYATHGVLSGPALERIEASLLKELVVTDTIPPQNALKNEKIRYLEAAPLLAEAMQRILSGASLSDLFEHLP